VTPSHAVNADTLIKAIEVYLKKEQYGSNLDLLESLFKLYQQNREFDNAFYVILKKKDPRVFDYLDR
jgi:hypothetical protein